MPHFKTRGPVVVSSVLWNRRSRRPLVPLSAPDFRSSSRASRGMWHCGGLNAFGAFPPFCLPTVLCAMRLRRSTIGSHRNGGGGGNNPYRHQMFGGYAFSLCSVRQRCIRHRNCFQISAPLPGTFQVLRSGCRADARIACAGGRGHNVRLHGAEK